MGVTRGFDIIKFSGSVNKFGLKRIRDMNSINTIVYPNASFTE